MHTTDYTDTFIEVAEDCPVEAAVEPPAKSSPTVAQLHYELISEEPYARTSDEVVFETHARRAGVSSDARAAVRDELFSKGQPCLRSSPLGKRYGWGIHFDGEGRVALVARDSADYARLAADPALRHTRAMRSKRA